jgi:uncharacterized phage protein gp47/JayE
MTFGLTPQGFSIKRLPQIKSEIDNALRTSLGNGINLLPTELFGQIVGIISERESQIWELANAVYDSFFPNNAQGVNLDNVVAITGIKRLDATKATGIGTAYGALGTIIPIGLVVSAIDDPTKRFVTSEVATIAAGTDAIQLIQFSSVPDAGQWTLSYLGNQSSVLNFNSNAAAIEAALTALPGLTGLTVSGDYTTGFEVTFAGLAGSQTQPILILSSSTLTNTSIAIGVSITEDTAGILPNITVPIIAETTGKRDAFANSLTVIETPISGLISFNNENDIDNGKNIETDGELRIRRLNTLANPGASTLDSIRAALLEINEVKDARVFENDTDAVDIYGRPAHSIEAVVLEGVNQEIADVIWNTKAAGIATYGSETETVSDTMGFTHTVKFSRPTEIDIYITVDNLVTDPDTFPVDGMDAIKAALATFGDSEFSIGDDVLYNRLHCPIANISGVISYDLFIGTAPSPSGQVNIAIADDERAFFDTPNFVVTS